MPIERAETLYPRNTVTVDTGTGINVRFLSSGNGGTSNASQTVTAAHTDDLAARTWNPATSGVSTNVTPDNVGNRNGWALRLAEDSTPVDDTNCNTMLPAQTVTVTFDCTLTASGGTGNLGGTITPTFQAALHSYDPATDTGTSIASGTSASVSWTTATLGNDAGTFKVVTVTISVGADHEFAAGKILMLKLGMTSVGTLPDPVTGTTTYTYTLRVDDNDTKVAFASGKALKQLCALTSSLVGRGVPSRGASALTMAKSLVGKGVPTGAKAVVASRSFSLVGKGVPTFTKFTTVYRDFSLVGKGTVTGRIEIPIDEVPEGGGGSTEVEPRRVMVRGRTFTRTGTKRYS